MVGISREVFRSEGHLEHQRLVLFRWSWRESIRNEQRCSGPADRNRVGRSRIKATGGAHDALHFRAWTSEETAATSGALHVV